MDGKSAYRIQEEMGITYNTVYKWQNRFLEKGLDGFKDKTRSGQPRKITTEETIKVLDMTMHTISSESTYWSINLMSRYTGLPRYRIETIWKAANIKPHLRATFNFSKDPNFAEKVIDIVGLYMNPPDNAIILSVDEKNTNTSTRLHSTAIAITSRICRMPYS